MPNLLVSRQKLIDHGEISRKVGNWMSCLLLDNRNPHIHVFDNDVDGISSDPNSPLELMGSEEMRFLGEREREDVYLTRKILSAKFLSHILEALYESNAKIQGQKVYVSYCRLAYHRNRCLSEISPSNFSSFRFSNQQSSCTISEFPLLSTNGRLNTEALSMPKLPTSHRPSPLSNCQIQLFDQHHRSSTTSRRTLCIL